MIRTLVAYFRNRHRGALLLLISISSIIYLPFISNDFFFDDLNFFIGSTPIYAANEVLRFKLRSIPYALLGWISILSGHTVPHVYHLLNTVVHICNALLLFHLLRLLLQTNTSLTPNKIAWSAWAGALFYAAHPVAVYAVGYLIQFSILSATLFCLAMLYSYLQALITEKKIWFVGSAFFYGVAVFSKEHAIMAPALTVLCTIIMDAQFKKNKASVILLWLTFIFISFFALSRVNIGVSAPYEYDAAFQLQQQNIGLKGWELQLISMTTQAYLYFKYLLLWVIPNPSWMSIDMREPIMKTWSSWEAFLAAALFLLYGIFGARLIFRRGTAGLVGLGLLYPYVMFIVEFSITRIQEPFVLYRSYLWMPGMMILPAILFSRLPSKRFVILYTLVVFLIFVPISWNRLWVFSDSYRMWNEAALLIAGKDVAGSSRIYFNRGKLALDARNWKPAADDFSHVIQINPAIKESYVHLGTAYLELKQFENALSSFNSAIDIEPKYADAYYGKGLVQLRLHKQQEASINFNMACKYGHPIACLMKAR